MSLRPLAEGDESLILATMDVDGADCDRDRPAWLTATVETALDSAGVGAWQYNPGTETVWLSDRAQQLHGGSIGEAEQALETMVELYAPADRTALREGIDQAIHDGESYDSVHELAAEDRRVRVRAIPETPVGEAHVVRGTLEEVTKLEETHFPVLSEAGQQLIQASSRPETAEIIIDAAEQILGYDEAAVRLLDDDDRTLEVVATTREDVAAAGEPPRYDVDEDVPAARAFRENEPEIVADLDVADDEYDRGALRSGLYVPIGSHGVFSCGDPAPNAYDETDVELVTVLAKLASAVYSRLESEFELRGQSRELEQVDTRLELALEETDTGVWEWNLDNDDVRWDETSERLFGYEPGESPGDFAGFANRVPAEDLQRVEERIDHAIETGEQYGAEFRVRPPGEDQRWVQARGVVEYDDSGEPERLLGIQTDITTRKDRELELKSYRELFENTTDCVVEIERVDGNSIIRRVNAAFEEVFGYTETEVRGEDIHDQLTPEEHRDEAMRVRQEYLEGNQPVVEVTRNTADGQREFLMRAVNFRDRFYVVYTDITEKKDRERKLEELNTRLELALEETDTGVWEWDLDTDEVIWDEASEQLFGYESGEFPGTFDGFSDRVHDEDLPAVLETIDAALETHDEYRADFRVTLPDSDQRWVQARGVVECDESGTPTRMLGIQTDITERKERERAVEQARTQLRRVIDLIPDPLYAKTLDDEVILSNEANAALHGMTPEEIEGTREREIESDVENIENFDKYRQREVDVVETGESMTFEEELKDPDGETHIFKTTRIPFEAVRGDDAVVLGYARDVTDLKEYEQELEQSNEKLDQFASVVSHDLRNPLAVILGHARHVDVDDDARPHLDEIEQAATRMEEMIDELLTLSRAGQDIEDPDPVLLAEVVRESWSNVQPEGVELDLSVPEFVTIAADRGRLMNVFENLIRNARDHNSPPLTIRIGMTEPPEATGGDSIGFFVADDGDGIPEAKREEVFDHGYTTSHEGTGFGLSIVADIVEAHDWDVDVTESDAGGARFEITGVGTRN